VDAAFRCRREHAEERDLEDDGEVDGELEEAEEGLLVFALFDMRLLLQRSFCLGQGGGSNLAVLGWNKPATSLGLSAYCP